MWYGPWKWLNRDLPSIADRYKSLASFLLASAGDASSVMEGEHEGRAMNGSAQGKDGRSWQRRAVWEWSLTQMSVPDESSWSQWSQDRVVANLAEDIQLEGVRRREHGRGDHASKPKETGQQTQRGLVKAKNINSR